MLNSRPLMFFIKKFPVIVSRGAGQEVGRSCHILEFKGKKVMVSPQLCM